LGCTANVHGFASLLLALLVHNNVLLWLL